MHRSNLHSGLTFLLSVTFAVENQVSAYKSRDYYVTYILVDNEVAISAAIPGINEMGIVINQTAKNKHVPEGLLKEPGGLLMSACKQFAIRFPTN